MKNKQFVRWTAYALLALGVIYIGLIVWGIITQDPKTGFIRENVRILMEITTMFSAIILLFFAFSIKSMLGIDNLLTEISVVFMIILVTQTSIVHFVSITISDQLINTVPLLSPVLSLNWCAGYFLIRPVFRILERNFVYCRFLLFYKLLKDWIIAYTQFFEFRLL